MSEHWRNVTTELPSLRRAVNANILKGGRSVVARASNKLQFRIVGVKTRRGVVYGQALSSGKWVAICEWETI